MNLLHNLKILPLILALTTSSSPPTPGVIRLRNGRNIRNVSEYLDINWKEQKSLVEDTELFMISSRIRHKGRQLTAKQIANDIKFIANGGVVNFFILPENAIVFKELFEFWDATATVEKVDADIDAALEAELINVPNSLQLVSVRDLIKLQYLWKVLGLKIVEELVALKLTLFLENQQAKYLTDEWLEDETEWKGRPFNPKMESQWVKRRFGKALLKGREMEFKNDLKNSSRQFLEVNAQTLTSLFHSLDEMETKEEVDVAISAAVANQLHSLPNYWMLSNEDLIKTLYLRSRPETNAQTAIRRIRWRWGPNAIIKYLNLRTINRERVISFWMPHQIERTWLNNFYANVSFSLLIVCYVVNYFEITYLFNQMLKRLYNAFWSIWLM